VMRGCLNHEHGVDYSTARVPGIHSSYVAIRGAAGVKHRPDPAKGLGLGNDGPWRGAADGRPSVNGDTRDRLVELRPMAHELGLRFGLGPRP
jgi:hypothetical protein